MGHQFNYELDDRQIKLTMLSASLKYDETAWDKFQALPITEHKVGINNPLPKLEIGISRSVIVPVLFILLIGGLSAILFNVVDFKKKDPITAEIPLVIPEITKTAVSTNNVTAPKTQPVNKAVVINTQSVVATKTPTLSLAAVTTSVNTEKKKIAVVEPKQNNTATNSDNKIKKENQTTELVKTNTEPVIAKTKKKKNIKAITEEIPVIIPQTTIIKETEVKEPEIIGLPENP